MRNLRNFFPTKLFSASSKRRSQRPSRRGNTVARRLSSEALEKRELLAGDVWENPSHNYHSAYDVNADLKLSVADVLVCLTKVGDPPVEGEAPSEAGQKYIFADVNDDGVYSPADVLGVINALGRGEGVNNPLAEVYLGLRTADDEAIIKDGNGEYNVDVGEKFHLEVRYSDLRPFFEGATGAFNIKADVIASLPDYLVPVMRETQRHDFPVGVFTESSVTGVEIMQEGGSTFTISGTQFQQNPVGIWKDALSQFGYEEGSDYAFSQPIAPTDYFRFQTHWVGAEFDNVDVPNITVAVQQSAGAALEVDLTDISPFVAGPNGDIPNPEALKFNLDLDVRTFSPGHTGRTTLYDQLNSGSFDTERENGRPGIIEAGGVLVSVGGVPAIDSGFTGQGPLDPDTLERGNDMFSIPVMINQPVQGLVLNLAPSFPTSDESLLLFQATNGNDPGVLTADDVIVDNYDPNGSDPPSDSENPGVAFAIVNALGENRDPTHDGNIVESFTQNDSPANIDLLQGATDLDNNTLAIENFSITGNAIGVEGFGTQVTVTPEAYKFLSQSESEVVIMNYDIVDGAGGSVGRTATVTIDGLDDPATEVSGTTTGNVTEDGTLVASGLLTVADPDTGDDQVQSQTNTVGIYGTFSINVNGDWTYSLSNDATNVQALKDGATPVDTFSVLSKDGQASVDVIITINGVNDAPTKDDPVTAMFSEEDAPAMVNLLTGASDVDQDDVLSVANYSVASGNAVGVVLNGNGVNVNPGAYGFLEDNQSAVVVLNYDIVDVIGASVSQTATITVTGVSNFSPVITFAAGENVGELTELSATPTVLNAISNPAGSLVSANATGPGLGHNYGWQFSVDKPIKISELGAFADANFVSVNASQTNPDKIRVCLWDVSTGKRMTYVDLQRSNYGGQAGQFVYKSINPIPLAAGGSYRISVTSQLVPLEFYSNGTSQTMEGTGVFSNFQGGFVGQFSGASHYPNQVVSGASGGFVGGNFKWYEDTKHLELQTLSFSDADPADTHSVSTAATEADYVGTFSAVLITPAVDGVGGEVEWSFDALDAELDELAKDEVRPQIYEVIVTDSNGGTAVEQVTITLNGVNDQPNVLEPIERVFNSGMPMETISLLTGAFDVDGDTIGVEVGFSIVGDDTTGVSVNQADSNVTVTPSAYESLDLGEQATVDIVYTIVDQHGAVVEQIAEFTFNGLNDPPTGPSSPIAEVFTQNDGVQTVSLIAGAVDPEGDTLTIDGVSFDPMNPAGFLIVNSDSVEVTTGAYVYLNDGDDTEIEIMYVIADGAGNLTDEQTATITITGANDDATIEGLASGGVTEDTAVTDGQLTASGTLTVTDVDTGQAIFNTSVISQEGNLGTLEITDAGAWSYTLNNSQQVVQQLGDADEITDTFTVKSIDGTAQENIVITISGLNDAAVISGDTVGNVIEDASNDLTDSGNLIIIDADAGESTFNTVVEKVGSELGDLSIDATGAWNYSLNNELEAVQALPDGETLVEQFRVKSFDGFTNKTIVVTVTGVNDVPVFGGEIAGSVTEDATPILMTGGALTIVDVDANESSVNTTVTPTGQTLGTLTILADGTWSYEADSTQDDIQALVNNQFIEETFTVISSDESETQVITITINGTNDAPEAVDDERLALKDGVGILVDVLANDNAGAGGLEDPNQVISIVTDSLQLSEIASNGVSPDGFVAIEDGKISYVPGPNFEGTATIDYQITDGVSGSVDTGTLIVSVVNFVPSTLGGSVFIDNIENWRDVRDYGATPIRNGVQDEGEKGFTSIRIKLVSYDNYTSQPIDREVLTDVDGKFEFTDIAPGVYSVVYEQSDQIRFNGNLVHEVTIPAFGDVQRNNLHYGVYGTQGSAMSGVGLLASSYLRTDATIAQISDGGREGGLVCLDSSGQQSFIVLGSGFDDIEFAELELNEANDAALLTLLTDQGQRLSAVLADEFFVLSSDKCGIQFFGSLNDHVFQEVGTDTTAFDNFRTAVDDFEDNNNDA